LVFDIVPINRHIFSISCIISLVAICTTSNFQHAAGINMTAEKKAAAFCSCYQQSGD
jgi:hypothetical protein